jgi:predicted permease
MKTIRRFFSRAIGSFTGRHREADLAAEMEMHVQMQAEDNMRSGMSPQEARRAAQLKFGGVELAKENYRDQRGLPQLDLLFQDVCHAMPQFGRNPGFTAVVVLTLTLGIGANTAVFSALSAVMLRKLPVHDADRLVILNTTYSINSQSGDGDTSLTEYIFEQMRAQREVFSDVIGFAPLSFQKAAVRYGREPEEAYVEMVSGDFFSGLGVPALVGRTFQLEDERAHLQLAVLSYDYWQRRTHADPGAVGHILEIKGMPFTVVGVAARGFEGVDHGRPGEVWIPLQANPNLQPWDQAPGTGLNLYGSAHTWWCPKGIGRLRRGMVEAQALARLQPLFQRAAVEGVYVPNGTPVPKLYFKPARGIEGLRDQYKDALSALMLMVWLVLLIACLNIAMLLLARHSARQREFSLRMALGGGAGRFFRQLVTESMLLVGAGGVLGLALAFWATRALAAWSNLDLNLLPDRTVLLYALALTLLAGLAFGLAPLRSLTRIPIAPALRASAATGFQTQTQIRGNQVVMVLQTSLCLALVVGAGLLLQSLRNLQKVPLGIRSSGLLVFGISPQNLPAGAHALRFYRGLLNLLRGIPGVDGVTVSQLRPGSGASNNTSVLVDDASPQGNRNARVRWNGAGPDYFHVMGTPVVLGRDFTDTDAQTSPRVAIVNQTFVEHYMPHQEPLGHQMTPGAGPSRTIVGVVKDSKYTGVQETATPMAWFPYAQLSGLGELQVELLTAAKADAVLGEVRQAMLRFAPELPLLQPMTQQEQFERSFSEERLVARLAVFFGLTSILLVAIGLYGTLSYAMNRRSAEVGIRMALGAQRAELLWMVLRKTLLVSLAGIGIGLPPAIAGARLLRSLLFGVTPGDHWIFGCAIAGIIVVAVAAGLIPARRMASSQRSAVSSLQIVGQALG